MTIATQKKTAEKNKKEKKSFAEAKLFFYPIAKLNVKI